MLLLMILSPIGNNQRPSARLVHKQNGAWKCEIDSILYLTMVFVGRLYVQIYFEVKRAASAVSDTGFGVAMTKIRPQVEIPLAAIQVWKVTWRSPV